MRVDIRLEHVGARCIPANVAYERSLSLIAAHYAHSHPRSPGRIRQTQLKRLSDQINGRVASGRRLGPQTLRHFDKSEQLFDVVQVNSEFFPGLCDLSLELEHLFEVRSLLRVKC